jgi:hypothetical protein
MFRELMNFSYQRSALQAFGWYLTFFLIGALVGGIVATLFVGAATSFTDGLQKGAVVGRFIIVPYHVVLAVALLWSRWRAVVNIFLALGAIVLSIFLGVLGGLSPLAVLTTRPSQKSHTEIGQVFE